MRTPQTPGAVASNQRIAVDIGSTVVKIARIADGDKLIAQDFYPRDFEAGIEAQVLSLFDNLAVPRDSRDILVCSSANGGLRVGIVCLTKHFSGATVRDQVLLAGANPMFMHNLDEEGGNLNHVDILLVTGGIDCEDAAPLEKRLRRFQAQRYHFGSLLYAGNKYLAKLFVDLYPEAVVIPNPLATTLSGRTKSVFETVRRAYLNDLVYKEGVSKLSRNLSKGVRPTPEIVNRGFQRALMHCSDIPISGACLLLDIGGATTDLHYTVEIIRDESDERPSTGCSVARYVFTDLGIAASRDSLVLQIRSHSRLYEFLSTVLEDNVTEAYRLLREGEFQPGPELLAYACLFLALDRFAHGRGPGLPVADLSKVAQIMLTGGAAQALTERLVARLVHMLLPESANNLAVFIDRRYQMWIDGITWSAPGSD